MAKYITVVIKYEDGKERSDFHENMEVLGGTVTAVQFNDAIAEMEEMEGYIQDLEGKIE
jgi:hypothetical protein